MSSLPDSARENDLGAKLFAGKDWLDARGPMVLSTAMWQQLIKLGRVLRKFQEVCDVLYMRSVEGRAPAYIAQWLDAGKPQWLIAHARHASQRGKLPRIIRPDLLLAGDVVHLTELDSVPGGIGLTAALQERFYGSHSSIDTGGGMLASWQRLFAEHDVIISQESGDYRPEMEWLAARTAGQVVFSAEDYVPRGRAVYRFVECFDLPQIKHTQEWLAAAEGGTVFTPPMRPHLEEKLWLALLWLQPLEQEWRGLLGEAYFKMMREITPRSWVVCPEALPPHAVLPELEVNSWNDVKEFSQKRRQLVLKPSGFSPLAWGARGVVMGHDVSQGEWAEALDRALKDFATTPHILQEFRPAMPVELPHIARSGEDATVKARVRLCPYYFLEKEQVTLAGVLVTGCPANKKIIHGMSDAVITIAGSAV